MGEAFRIGGVSVAVGEEETMGSIKGRRGKVRDEGRAAEGEEA